MKSHVIDSNATAACGACGTPIVGCGIVIVETDHESRDLITCVTCKRPYFRVGGSVRFVSPDGHKLFVPEATPAATA